MMTAMILASATATLIFCYPEISTTTYRSEDEWAIDVQEKTLQNYKITIGINRTYRSGIIFTCKTYFGNGISLATLKRILIFTNPSIGINYLYKPQEFQLLLKTAF